MDHQQWRWLHPWREVNSETYYPSPGLIRFRGRHRLRTPRRPLDAREAAALVRETQEVHDRFQEELDRCVDRLLDTLFGQDSSPDENGSP